MIDLCFKDNVASDEWSRVVIVYEPVWAFGTATTATTATRAQLVEVLALLRKWLADNVSTHVAQSTRILYGGCMMNTPIGRELSFHADFDGFFVGGAVLTTLPIDIDTLTFEMLDLKELE